MKAHISRPAAGPRERVREAPDLEVTFEQQHAPLAQLGNNGREGESADARADDDGVVRILSGHAVLHTKPLHGTAAMGNLNINEKREAVTLVTSKEESLGRRFLPTLLLPKAG